MADGVNMYGVTNIYNRINILIIIILGFSYQSQFRKFKKIFSISNGKYISETYKNNILNEIHIFFFLRKQETILYEINARQN